MQPGKETFDFPSAPATAKRSAILSGRTTAAALVGGDHLDTVALAQQRIERIAVVPAVADQSRGELGEERRVERGGDEVRFIRRSAGHVHGERKTMAVADRHDLALFTTAGRANGRAPFLALAKVASTKASVRSSCRDRAGPQRAASAADRGDRCAATAESAGDTFDTAGSVGAGHARRHRCAATARASIQGAHGHQAVGADGTSIRARPIGRR
jgi:hypothetical protein